MQSTLFEPQSLPQLPKPGFIDHWVFESPIPLALACIALGFIALGILRHTKASKLAPLFPVLGLVLAGSIFLIGQLTTTDAEHLTDRARQLVQATAKGDERALQSLLAEQVRIESSLVSQSGRARIITLASTRGSPMIQSATTKEIRVGLLGDQLARTQIKIRVKGDMIPPTSWWTLDWTRPSLDSDQWVVTHIESLWIQGFSSP
jgi:hypothetical protein